MGLVFSSGMKTGKTDLIALDQAKRFFVSKVLLASFHIQFNYGTSNATSPQCPWQKADLNIR